MTERVNSDQQYEVPIVKPVVYIVVFFVMLVLIFLMTGISYLDLGIFNVIILLAFAVFKASLDVFFYMHIRHSSRLLKMTVLSGIFAFLILITLTMSDYISRAWGMW